jgi:hypothetical protein
LSLRPVAYDAFGFVPAAPEPAPGEEPERAAQVDARLLGLELQYGRPLTVPPPGGGSVVNADGCVSPSGKRVIFLSDRSGTPDSAQYFDGGDLMQLTDTSASSTPPQFPATNFTVCAWVRPDRDAGNQQLVGNYYWGNRHGWCLKLGDEDGVGFFLEAYIDKEDQYGNGFTWVAAQSGVRPEIGTWYHLVGTFELGADSTVLRIYVNGALADEYSLTGAWPWRRETVPDIYAGDDRVGTSPFQGAIDEIRIYERVLTAGEVQRVYQAP